MITKLDLVQDWLPRYTGMPLNQFGEYVLLTNFRNYVTRFAEKFSCAVYGIDRPMQAATNTDGLTIINFGIGSPNAATVMDLLTAYNPKAVLFLGKCGGLKRSTEIGHFILPIGAIRGEGTSDDYLPKLVPTSSSRKSWSIATSTIALASSTRRTAASGSMTTTFASN
jgi:AMP nucleosidase